ncbi:MAG: diguanylate cyclase [Hungatella sp.]|nr:diguanylate cyclase [Hungatella sp.]
MSKEQEFKQKILIADDSEMNRSILADMLESEYEIIEAENGVEAIACIQKHGPELSLILLDIVMPELDGFGVLEVMNRHHWIDEIPVIMISSESSSFHVERAYELGITDYISRPFDAVIVHHRVVNTIVLYAKQKKLAALVMEQIDEKEKQSSLMIDILSHIVEFRNGESGLHVLHIRALTELLLKHLNRVSDKYHFTQEEISMICIASALHDIGKISIPGEILNKPGRLTKEEFETMKTHTTIGAEMLEKLSFHQEEPLVKEAYAICRWHHERYDGRGYPDGLKGDEIPIHAQIVALADVYDALTSERVYKKAFPHEEAIRMICNGECGAFNPLLLQCLNEIADTLQENLNNTKTGQIDEQELQDILEEKLQPKDNPASERTLQLLEHERMKCSFYASMSEEIQFEYSVTPPILTLSEWGAERLGLPELIMDPLEDERVTAIMDLEEIKKLGDILHSTYQKNPVVKYDCKANIGGEARWMRIVVQALESSEENPEYTGVIGKAVDIHEARMRLDALEKLASHDTLTKLLTMDYAEKRIRERLAINTGDSYVLLLLDVDNIKEANDSRGRMFGDQILVHVAELLRLNVAELDIAARISGDEFLVLTKGRPGEKGVAQWIMSTLEGEYEGFKVSVCVGAAASEDVGADYDKLFKEADKALLMAKRRGAGQFCVYKDSMMEEKDL